MGNKIGVRVTSVRIRTWTLTLSILITLVFYFLVNVGIKQFDPIAFFFLCCIQITIYYTYFPDGELFGKKDDGYISNETSYNEKATKINQDGQIKRLQQFCEYEYQERRKRYIANECGLIGISLEELEIFKEMTEKEIKSLRKYTVDMGDGKARIINFTSHRRKKLYNLIYKDLPVQKNNPETIMSAVENDGTHSIQDGSIKYRIGMYIKKFFQATVIGGIFAYIGYTTKDGITIAEITQILMYLSNILINAITAFSAGETCSKVYKSRFYVELINFIDNFNEWNKTSPQEPILTVKE